MSKNLSVPYFSQLDNELNPDGSCNVTSMAMALHFFGIRGDGSRRQLEDQMYVKMISKTWDRHEPKDLAKLANSYPGIKDDFTDQGTLQLIRDNLDKGIPCIVHGWFTTFGHIFVVKGYTDDGRFYVNDPNGEWYPAGYDTSVSGENLIYSGRAIAALCGFSPYVKAMSKYNAFSADDAEKVDTIWVHQISKDDGTGSPARVETAAAPATASGSGRWASKFADVKKLVDTLDATRINNWKKFGPEILGACDDYGITDLHQVAYILATTSHESLFAPIREAYYLPGDFDSDERWRKENLRYYPYYGRGFVQLTHDYNYKWAQKAVNDKYGTSENFVSDPDRVMQPRYSAFILVKGMMEGHFNGHGVGLPGYVNATSQDYVEARRTVNVLDKAATIARYAEAYDNFLS